MRDDDDASTRNSRCCCSWWWRRILVRPETVVVPMCSPSFDSKDFDSWRLSSWWSRRNDDRWSYRNKSLASLHQEILVVLVVVVVGLLCFGVSWLWMLSSFDVVLEIVWQPRQHRWDDHHDVWHVKDHGSVACSTACLLACFLFDVRFLFVCLRGVWSFHLPRPFFSWFRFGLGRRTRNYSTVSTAK